LFKRLGLIHKTCPFTITLLLPVKDAVVLRTPCVYSIPCECSRFYIGQSGWSIQIRFNTI